jgi:hypothetical protein
MLMHHGARPARISPLATGALALGVLLGTADVGCAEWPADWLYLQRNRGWYFYREPSPRPPLPPSTEPEDAPALEPPDGVVPEVEPPDVTAIPTEGPALDAWLARLPDTELEYLVTAAPASAIRAWIPILMDQALTTLDRVSVRKYLLVQRESMRRSETFSRIWLEVIWTDATFDRPGAMPLGGLAQNIYDEERAARERHHLGAVRDSASLLLVIEPDCRQCEMAWRILKAWADEYRVTVRPIGATLTTLADGTAALPYPQIVDALQIAAFPSLYLVQPGRGHLTRLGTGILSEQEIATRLLRLIPDAPEGALTHASVLPIPDLVPTASLAP